MEGHLRRRSMEEEFPSFTEVLRQHDDVGTFTQNECCENEQLL